MNNFLRFFLFAALLGLVSPAFSQDYNLQYRSHMSFPGQTLANICGYAQDGREYALLGGRNGMIVVDVTNPDAPQFIVQIQGSEGNPGNGSFWREIKVYQHYAYVTTEEGGGLQIIDLSPLPSANLPHHNYKGDGAINGELNKLHALHVDVTKGFVYLYGGGLFLGGAKVLDLNQDPYNPKYVGKFDQFAYVHDGYVDNDTLYASHVNIGLLSVVDMKDKSNPLVLGTVETPGNFTHNNWLTDDRKYLLTTDETFPSFLASYDVSNPEDIRELDRVATTVDGMGALVHNTHILNGYAVTSWYTDGITIVDAHRPDNLVEVARYDTWSPAFDPKDPFNGCWGVYPYLPSGNLITSNIEVGVLNVLTPTYVRACYLEGKVTNGCNGFSLAGAKIEINSPDPRVNTVTNSRGEFKTGQVTPGDYTVTISKPGFVSQTLPFTFATAQVTELNVTLVPNNVTNLSGTVVDAGTQAPIADAPVTVYSNTQTYSLRTDANGQFKVECTAAGTYQVNAGAWGYRSVKTSVNGTTPITVSLQREYYDDFLLDLGWQEYTTAISGPWEWCEPLGNILNVNGADYQSNPEVDASADNNDRCYVTGNDSGPGSVDDIDYGYTVLTSPSMDFSLYSAPTFSFYYWFIDLGNNNGPALNDTFQVHVLVDGQSYPVFIQPESKDSWRFSGEIPFPPAAAHSNNVRVTFTVADNTPEHRVEGGMDIFKVSLGAVGTVESGAANALLSAAPNPSSSHFQLRYRWEEAAENPVLELRDLAGRLLSSQQLTSRTGVETVGADWAPGVYFATLRCGNDRAEPIKLIKN